MKLIGFVCALALAGAVGGCGDDSTPSGNGGSGGAGATGGTGGATGGTGGVGPTDQCIGAADTAVYDSATYVDTDGETLTGDDAVGQIAADCVFGAAPNLTSDGCGAETTAALGNPTPENIQALADCVVQCTVDQPIGLSAGCLTCYGASVSCGATFCAAECGPGAGGPDAPGCIDCRCGNNDAMADCFGAFDVCSGLPREPDECAN